MINKSNSTAPVRTFADFVIGVNCKSHVEGMTISWMPIFEGGGSFGPPELAEPWRYFENVFLLGLA
jgi:hypothetical protein